MIMASTLQNIPGNYALSRLPSISLEAILKADPFGFLKNPKGLLTKSWEGNQEMGSSTFVVVTIPKDEATIYASYVGDSGYCIMRLNPDSEDLVSLVHASSPQQRKFNFPYQLGWGKNGDHPDTALSFSHPVQNGDIVILGTDGLFDNVSCTDVVSPHLDLHYSQSSDSDKSELQFSELGGDYFKKSI